MNRVLFISSAMDEGKIPSDHRDRIFRFEDALEAYAYMESGSERGKIVMLTQYA